jgi:carbamoyltransferase
VINSFDSTARIQICKDEDTIFFKILSEFKKITGMPILLNTSFNVHGEPIINSVDEAFQHLLDGVVDYLIVGDKMFSVKSVNELESIFDI